MLRNRAIFVTGPAKGMGRDITLALARAGADLVLAGRDQAAIEKVADEVRRLKRRVSVQLCDVTEAQSVDDAFSAGLADLGYLDGLVCVHGTTGASMKRLWEQTTDDFEKVFSVNVLGVMLPMRAALRHFTAQRRGSIVTIGGTYGFKGAAGQSLYAATKWALRGMSKSAALEAGPFGVRVNSVCPGPVEGERLTRQLGEIALAQGRTLDAVMEDTRKGLALRRISNAEDIAAAVVFLLSEAARSITGTDMVVDGGSGV